MERLTNHFDYCNFIDCKFYDAELFKQGKCKFFDESIEHCHEKRMNDKLREYEDAEEQGLLARLPCKLGDSIYYVEDGYIYKFYANRIEINNGIDDWDYCIDNMNFKKSDFGKIAFLSLEEAEAALAKMEG